MADKYPSVVVSGELVWAFLGSRVNEMSGKYQVDIAKLSKEDANKLQTIGLKPRQEDPSKIAERQAEGKETFDRGTYITAKSSKPFFKLKNPDGSDFTGDSDAIGNGTKARVRVTAVPYEFRGKKGNSVGLHTVVILELVEYTKSSASENDPELYGDVKEGDLFD